MSYENGAILLLLAAIAFLTYADVRGWTGFTLRAGAALLALVALCL